MNNPLKRHLSNVSYLYKLDWKRIFHNKLTLFFVVALFILPSLYAWFNIEALWDPYSNTGDIPIAVYSDDKTVEVMGKRVNVGDELIDNLKKNHKIGWRFVKSKEALDQGVKTGKYYAGIYLPSDFTKNLTSFIKGDIKKPVIEYRVNQKINAIAPKITDKGAGTIQSTIADQFINVVSDTLLKVFNEVGFQLDKNLISINKIKSQILYVDEHMSEFDDYTKEIVALNTKMPELKEKLNKANKFMEYIPEVNDVGEKVKMVNAMIPQIEKGGKLILELQKDIPQIENAGRQLNMIDNDFGEVQSIMDDSINEAKKVIGIIQNAQEVIPEVKNMAEEVNSTLPEIKDGIRAVQNALPDVAKSAEVGLNLVKILSQDIADFTQAIINSNIIGDIETNRPVIQKDLSALSGKIDSIIGMLNSQKHLLNTLNKELGNKGMSQKIDQINNSINQLTKLKSLVNEAINNAPALDTQGMERILNQINSTAKEVNLLVSRIDVNGIYADINNMLDEFDEILGSAKSISNTIIDDNIIGRVDSVLSDTVHIINRTIDILEKYQKEMPSIKNEIHTANVLLNDNMNLIIGAINESASIYTNDFPNIKSKLGQATKFIDNDLPGVEADLQKTLKLANEKFPDVEKAVSMADTLIKEDWPGIKRGIHKAANAIKRGEKEVDMGELIKLLKSDAKEESDFISNPVKLDQKDIYPIPNYGSASTPFYTVLCLWVGALLLSSLTTTDYYIEEEDQKRFSKREIFTARLLTYLTIATCQAFIVSMGNLHLLHVYSANPVAHVLLCMYVGAVFTIIIYVLAALFDNLGKGIAVIILVLSISGGGGNFPIQMSGPFFRWINPMLPFTYACNLIRETIGGIYKPTVVYTMTVLAIFAVSFLIFGYLIYPLIKDKIKAIASMAHEGHFLH